MIKTTTNLSALDVLSWANFRRLNLMQVWVWIDLIDASNLVLATLSAKNKHDYCIGCYILTCQDQVHIFNKLYGNNGRIKTSKISIILDYETKTQEDCLTLDVHAATVICKCFFVFLFNHWKSSYMFSCLYCSSVHIVHFTLLIEMNFYTITCFFCFVLFLFLIGGKA